MPNCKFCKKELTPITDVHYWFSFDCFYCNIEYNKELDFGRYNFGRYLITEDQIYLHLKFKIMSAKLAKHTRYRIEPIVEFPILEKDFDLPITNLIIKAQQLIPFT